MSDGSLKVISEVKIGDEVVTHTGGFGKVNEVFDKVINDDLYHYDYVCARDRF